jgi:uncharacterized coiled-coil protein SlyX
MGPAAIRHGRKRTLAQPNYQFAKRQRDLAKQRKKEEKRLKKLAARQDQPADASAATTPPAPADQSGQPS